MSSSQAVMEQVVDVEPPRVEPGMDLEWEDTESRKGTMKKAWRSTLGGPRR